MSSASTVPPQASTSLRARVIRGSAWSIIYAGLNQALRLGSNLVLTRLLAPEIYGLMALVSAVSQGLRMFSDIGIGPSIVQSGRGDEPAFVNTAWTLQVLRGLFLWLCAGLIAWPASLVFDKPQLLYLIPVAGGRGGDRGAHLDERLHAPEASGALRPGHGAAVGLSGSGDRDHDHLGELRTERLGARRGGARL